MATEHTDKEKRVMTLEDRAFCYRYFSEFFCGTFPVELNAAWPVVAELCGVDACALKLDQRVKQDWARTFYGVGKDTVTLTQSTWLNSLRLQCQEPCRAAQEAYKKAGVEPNMGDDRLPEDHAGTLLGFMAWLLEGQNREAQAEAFFRNHFTGWWDSMLKASRAYLANENADRVLEAFEKFLARERAVFGLHGH